jgi:hypothetical protein
MKWLALLALGGCTPVIPFYFAESAETLKKGAVSLTLAGGGGGGQSRRAAGGSDALTIQSCCGGGAARISGGMGRQMEIGVETAIVGGDPANHNVNILTKFRYKVGFGKYLALVAGLGITGSVDTNTSKGNAGLGPDIGLIWSTGLIGRVLRIYGGGRFTFVFALEKDFYGAGGPTQGFVAPLGLSFAVAHPLRLYVEGGVVGGWSENRANPSQPVDVYGWIGGYGLFALAYAWNS